MKEDIYKILLPARKGRDDVDTTENKSTHRFMTVF
jgi:hypothetical protein